jgi:hypothetical protein
MNNYYVIFQDRTLVRYCAFLIYPQGLGTTNCGRKLKSTCKKAVWPLVALCSHKFRENPSTALKSIGGQTHRYIFHYLCYVNSRIFISS